MAAVVKGGLWDAQLKGAVSAEKAVCRSSLPEDLLKRSASQRTKAGNCLMEGIRSALGICERRDGGNGYSCKEHGDIRG